jgi:hypothetical protein
MRTLCIYVLHQYNLNVDFFIKNGIFLDPNVDFYFVINDTELKLDILGCKVINRQNINLDNGAWSHVLFMKDNEKFLYENYDYFVFINATVRGPFLPVWYKDKNWIKLFTDRITNELKLFGPMICIFDNKVHVQSMCFVTDRVGLQVGIDNGIFVKDEPPLDKFTICMKKEIGYSTAILNSGYNIGCMLKAYDGIDFRNFQSKVDTLCFFEPYSYFGTNVHPYEVIFWKILGDDRQSGHNKEVVDKYTNWTYRPQEIDSPFFDWIYYLLQNDDLRKAGIVTKDTAISHYTHCGRFENRKTNRCFETLKFFKIDLNPLRTSGLLNQFWSLVNGILIGHCVGRQIMVDKFYPDYNQNKTIPIQDIIDIQALNCLIAELGLKTHVTTNVIDANWMPSQYINPTKKTFECSDFISTLAFLQLEDEKYIDISDTFSDVIFKQNCDARIQQLFKRLISDIKFTKQVCDVIDYIKQSIGIFGEYKAVHLRLEDDIIKLRPYPQMTEKQYGDSVYEKYKECFSHHFKPTDAIFVSSHLSKSPNIYNYVLDELRSTYPKMTLTNSWRNMFPKFPQGRDIDALIDYLLCMDAELFVGYGFSTFSQAIKFAYDNKNKLSIILH